MDEPTRNDLVEALFAPARVRAFSAPVAASHITELREDERTAIEPMVENRRAEFATARACARAALAEFGIDAAVPRTEAGAPVWPHAMAGSISHTRGYCLAVAGSGSLTLGIDVELVARMSRAVERRILVDAERDGLDALSGDERQRRVATIFAAKEAFYKAHYAIEGRYFGFDAVAVSIDNGEVRYQVGSGTVAADMLQRVSGRARIDDGRAIVGVVIDTTGLVGTLPSRP